MATISYFLVLRKTEDMTFAVPALFVLFGIVVLISILFDLYKFHVINSQTSRSKVTLIGIILDEGSEFDELFVKIGCAIELRSESFFTEI